MWLVLFMTAVAVISLVSCAAVNNNVSLPPDVEWIRGRSHGCPKWPLDWTDCSKGNILCYELELRSVMEPCWKICPPLDDDPSSRACQAHCGDYFENVCKRLEEIPTKPVTSTTSATLSRNSQDIRPEVLISAIVVPIVAVILIVIIVGVVLYRRKRKPVKSKANVAVWTNGQSVVEMRPLLNGNGAAQDGSGTPAQPPPTFMIGDSSTVIVGGTNNFAGPVTTTQAKSPEATHSQTVQSSTSHNASADSSSALANDSSTNGSAGTDLPPSDGNVNPEPRMADADGITPPGIRQDILELQPDTEAPTRPIQDTNETLPQQSSDAAAPQPYVRMDSIHMAEGE